MEQHARDFAGDDAAVCGDDYGLHRAAAAGGMVWAAGDAGALLRVHAAGDRDWIRLRFLFAGGPLKWFIVCLFFLGLGGANFAMYTLWLPEQYPTECRGSAFAFATSVGRFAGAGFTFLVGAGVAHFHTIGKPVAFTALAFVVGLLLLPFGHETKGKVLPA